MNSRRRTMTSISMVFLAVTILSVSALGQNAYAAHHSTGSGISVNVDADLALAALVFGVIPIVATMLVFW